MDQAESLLTSIFIYRFAGLRLDFVVLLISLLGLLHFWIPHDGFVFGGNRSGDQGGIDDLALLHGHPPSASDGS